MKILDYIKLWWVFRREKDKITQEVKNMNDSKKWYQSKTVWFNVITSAITVAGALQSSALASDPKVQAGVVLFITVGNAILRFMTDSAITK